MSARPIDIAEGADTGFLLAALATRLGPGMEVVIRERSTPAKPDLRTACRRVVDLLGVPPRLEGYRCLIEALAMFCESEGEPPCMEAVYLRVRPLLRTKTRTSAEKAMRYAVAWVHRVLPDRAAGVLDTGDPKGGGTKATLQRLRGLVLDDLAQGGGR